MVIAGALSIIYSASVTNIAGKNAVEMHETRKNYPLVCDINPSVLIGL